jgi:hypothetical protein
MVALVASVNIHEWRTMSETLGTRLRVSLETANEKWLRDEIWKGEPSIGDMTLSQITAIATEDSIQYVQLAFLNQMETRFVIHVFTADLLLTVKSDGDAARTVHTTITPRALLSKVRVTSAPLIPDGKRRDEVPLTVELEYPNEALTLTTQGNTKPAERAKLKPLLESLIVDLRASN